MFILGMNWITVYTGYALLLGKCNNDVIHTVLHIIFPLCLHSCLILTIVAMYIAITYEIELLAS